MPQEKQEKPKLTRLQVNDVMIRSHRDLPLNYHVRRKIFDLYFTKVRETIVAGYTWTFPDESTIAIHADKNYYKRIKKKAENNIDFLNERTVVCVTGGFFANGHRYIFTSSGELNAMISKVLETKYHYILKPIA